MPTFVVVHHLHHLHLHHLRHLRPHPVLQRATATRATTGSTTNTRTTIRAPTWRKSMAATARAAGATCHRRRQHLPYLRPVLQRATASRATTGSTNTRTTIRAPPWRTSMAATARAAGATCHRHLPCHDLNHGLHAHRTIRGISPDRRNTIVVSHSTSASQ